MIFWAGWTLLVQSLVGGVVAQSGSASIGPDEIVITTGNEATRDATGILVLKADGTDLRHRNRLTRIVPPTGESLSLVATFEGDTLGESNQIGDNHLNAVPTWSLDGESLYVHRFDGAGTKHWDVVRLALPTAEMTNLTDRYRTEERTDWTVWFPHAGTPSMIVTPDASAPLPPTTAPATTRTMVQDETAPENQAGQLGGILVLVGVIAVWWSRRQDSPGDHRRPRRPTD
jgi:uncharacterized protein YjeT (DUF2065 family)